MGNIITTTNKLNFEVADSPYFIFKELPHQLFKVGTCHGQFGFLKNEIFILSVINDEPGNGHLTDVFEWFEHSCTTYGKNLLVLDFMNNKFYKHMIAKRGFIKLDEGEQNCIKVFNKFTYKKLLKNGNEILRKNTLTCI